MQCSKAQEVRLGFNSPFPTLDMQTPGENSNCAGRRVDFQHYYNGRGATATAAVRVLPWPEQAARIERKDVDRSSPPSLSFVR